jgi:hypothetical protein
MRGKFMKKIEKSNLLGRQSKPTQWVIILAALVITTALATNSILQSSPSATAAMSPEVKTVYLRLNATQPSLTQKIVVPAGVDALDLALGNDPDIKFVLRNPQGVAFDPSNPTAMNATLSTSTADNGTIYNKINLKKPGSGAWVLELSTNTPKSPNSLAVLEYTMDGLNLPSTALKIDYEQIEDQPILMTLAVDPAGLTLPAEAEVDIVNNLEDGSQKHRTVKLYDDGNNANGDFKAGDGLYSALSPALPPTAYVAFSKIPVMVGTETLELGGGWSMFAVYDKTARVTPKIVEEIAQDDNSDGLIDRLTFKIPIENVWREGPSFINAYLKGSNGNAAYITQDQLGFTKDMKFATMSVSAEDIKKEVGVDGPYEITGFRHEWMPNGPLEDANAQYAGISHHMIQYIEDFEYTTKAYSIKDFSRPYLENFKFISDRGIDTNGNGFFDQIAITFSVDSATNFDESLEWASESSLIAAPGTPDIKLRSGWPSLRSQIITLKLVKGTNTFELIFDVRELGLNNVGGPFHVLYPPSVYSQDLGNLVKGIATDLNVKYPNPFGVTKNYTGKLEGSNPIRNVGNGITSAGSVRINGNKTLLAGATITSNAPNVALPNVATLAANAVGTCSNSVVSGNKILATQAEFDKLFGTSACLSLQGDLTINQGISLQGKRLILNATSRLSINGTLNTKDSVVVASQVMINGALVSQNSKIYSLNPSSTFILNSGSSLGGITTVASAGGLIVNGTFSTPNTVYVNAALVAGRSILINGSLKGSVIAWAGDTLTLNGKSEIVGALYAKGDININGGTQLTLEKRSLNSDLPF